MLTLLRISQTEARTLGILLFDGAPFCVTLERPWLDNRKNESCIPAGEYVCRRVVSPRFGETFEVCDVPGRTDILFHPGNYPKDTTGCILPGSRLGPDCIRESRAAMRRFMKRLDGAQEFPLRIYGNMALVGNNHGGV